MRKLCRITFLAALAFAAIVPVFAQVGLSGVWVTQYREDQPERIPGPELGDYLGLPIKGVSLTMLIPGHRIQHSIGFIAPGESTSLFLRRCCYVCLVDALSFN